MVNASRILPCFCVSACLFGAVRPAFAQASTDTSNTPVVGAVTATEAPADVAPSLKPDIQKMPGFKDLFKPLGGDFRRMTTPANMMIATVGSATSISIYKLDPKLSNGSWGAEQTFGPGEHVGAFVWQTGGAFSTYLVGRMLDNQKVAQFGSELVRAQIVAQAATQAIKFSARRTRPDGTTLSFPSGHTASAFATASVLQGNFGWKAGIPAYAVAAWVGASRMQMQRHYLSDVIAGATIGILAGRSVTFGKGDTRFAVSPMAAEGGIGVSVNLIGNKK